LNIFTRSSNIVRFLSFQRKDQNSQDRGKGMKKKGGRGLLYTVMCLFFKLNIPNSSIRVVWCVHLGSFPLLGKGTKAFVHHERIFSFPPMVIAKNEICYSHSKEG
jgi:hypothetical protein